MAWFKVDDGLHASRKLLKIPKRTRFAAIGLWTVAGSWAADQLTDGNVPDYMIREWGAPPAAPAALVDAGLWERTEGGYVFCNWHEYQPSKQDVDADRAASRERMQNLRARRRNARVDATQPVRNEHASATHGLRNEDVDATQALHKPYISATHGLRNSENPRDHAENADLFGRTVTNSSENVRNPDPTRPDPTRPNKDKEEAGASSLPRKRATRISEDFTVTPEMRLWASSKAPDADLITETEKFINYWVAKSGKDATKLDWAATWRNWILNAKTSQARPDHSARGLAKGMAMLQAYDAQQTQPFELEA